MTQQEAINKALKLLRLARCAGATPDEAALAAAKAQEVIDSYKLNVDDVDFDKQEQERDNEEVKDFDYTDPLGAVSERNRSWGVRLASIVARANQCRILFRINHSDYSRTLRVIGRPSDVAAVRYLYSFFAMQVDELADKCCRGNSATYKNHFKIGVTDAIHVKLHQQRETTLAEKRAGAGSNMALVRVNSAIAKLEKRGADVDAFIEWKFHKLGKRSKAGSVKTFTGGRKHGQVEGQNIRMTGAKASLGAGRKELE